MGVHRSKVGPAHLEGRCQSRDEDVKAHQPFCRDYSLRCDVFFVWFKFDTSELPYEKVHKRVVAQGRH